MRANHLEKRIGLARGNRAGRRIAAVLVASLVMLLGAPIPASAELPVGSDEDITAPTITSFTLAPTTVDVTSAAVTVNGTFTASDDLSGISSIFMRFSSPGGQNLFFSASGGGSLSGTFSTAAVVETFRENGTWTLSALSITDQVDNFTSYTPAQASVLGPTTLEVISNGDLVAPEISAMRVSPDPVDVSSSTQDVFAEFDASDLGTGVSQISAVLVSPSRRQSVRVSTSAINRISGDAWNGTYRARFVNSGTSDYGIPRHSEPGEWTLAFIQAYDRAGNSRVYNALNPPSSLVGVPLTVISDPADVTPPSLSSYDFSPTAIDVTDGSATVQVTFNVSDDLAGVKIASLTFRSPSIASASPMIVSRSADELYPLSAPKLLDGTLTGSVTFPQFDRAGTWTVLQVCVLDWVNWRTCYSGTQLTGLGPTDLTVTDTTSDADQPPTVTLSGPADTDEGQTETYIYTATDPDGDPLTITESCGDHGVHIDTAAANSFDCTFPDGPATSTVAVTAHDGELGDSDSIEVTVANVAPSVGPISIPDALEPVAVGTEIQASASFTDPGVDDTHTAEWDWGDGTTSAGLVDQGAGAVSGSHIYTVAGVYTVTLTVTDDDLAAGQSVFEFVVVYDPSAGFVTGGGWIDSPAGAYTDDPTLTGKANFGFVSKYKKGANVPDGNTQFQFRAGDLNFHSTVYEWLVIAGSRAQYKGSGTINGAGDYGFMLTANDGQQAGGGGEDRFRIKIWDKVTGDVTYDNQIGDSGDAAASDAIEGGSIVIHAK